ncbi:hypothetical protein ACF0H5_009051 [Mactra antiquata]
MAKTSRKKGFVVPFSQTKPNTNHHIENKSHSESNVEWSPVHIGRLTHTITPCTRKKIKQRFARCLSTRYSNTRDLSPGITVPVEFSQSSCVSVVTVDSDDDDETNDVIHDDANFRENELNMTTVHVGANFGEIEPNMTTVHVGANFGEIEPNMTTVHAGANFGEIEPSMTTVHAGANFGENEPNMITELCSKTLEYIEDPRPEPFDLDIEYEEPVDGVENQPSNVCNDKENTDCTSKEVVADRNCNVGLISECTDQMKGKSENSEIFPSSEIAEKNKEMKFAKKESLQPSNHVIDAERSHARKHQHRSKIKKIVIDGQIPTNNDTGSNLNISRKKSHKSSKKTVDGTRVKSNLENMFTTSNKSECYTETSINKSKKTWTISDIGNRKVGGSCPDSTLRKLLKTAFAKPKRKHPLTSSEKIKRGVLKTLMKLHTEIIQLQDRRKNLLRERDAELAATSGTIIPNSYKVNEVIQGLVEE